MVVVLCRSGALLADDSIQNSAVISKEALLLQHPKFQENFDQYEVLEDAAKIPADVSVLIFFGTWCHDSQREVPQNAENFGGCWVFTEDSLKMVTLDYSKTDPEGLAVANAVEFTPTFIFFRQQKEIGRIVERPASTLEEAMSELLVQQ